LISIYGYIFSGMAEGDRSFEFPLLGCTSSNKLALTGGKECSRDKGPPPQAKSLGIVHLVALDTRHHVAIWPCGMTMIGGNSSQLDA